LQSAAWFDDDMLYLPVEVYFFSFNSPGLNESDTPENLNWAALTSGPWLIVKWTPRRLGNFCPSDDFHLRLACEPKVLKRLFLVSLALLPQLQD
jgi:hypothetical protein